MQRQISYIALSELETAFDERNPRAHRSLDLVADAVNDLGFIESIVLDDRTGKLVAGHGRVMVLRRMKDDDREPPDGVTVDADDGEWAVPVTTGWASRSDDEAARALIVLNRAAELGEWDEEATLALLDELATATRGLELVGFTQAERDALEAVLSDADSEIDADYDPESREDGLRTLTLALPKQHFDTTRDMLKATAPDVDGHSAYRMGLALLQLLGIDDN